MARKIIVLLIIAGFSYHSGFCQRVTVRVDVQRSPHLTGLSKVQIEKRILDTLIYRSNCLNFWKQISFVNATPDYILEISVLDTIVAFGTVQGTKIQTRLFESGVPANNLPKWKSFGVGYSDRLGKINYEQLLESYFSWVPIIAWQQLDLIPLSKWRHLDSNNLRQTDSLQYFREVFVKFENQNSPDTTLVRTLISEVLVKEQEFYGCVRSGSNSWFNLCFQQNDLLTSNPLLLKFSLSENDGQFRVKLQLQNQDAVYSGLDLEVPTEITFPLSELHETPTRVMQKIKTMLSTLFRLNLK